MIAGAVGACVLGVVSAHAGDSPDQATVDAQATAHAQSVQAQAVAAKAGYDAQTAMYQAQEEKLKAAQAAVPSSGLTNSATPGSAAGSAEANYLAAQLISQMANEIAGKVGCGAGNPPVVVFSGVSAPDLSDWAAFDQRLTSVAADMKTALDQVDKVKPQPGREHLYGAPVILALAPALLSFLNSADAVQGVTVTEDDSVLVTGVAGGLLAKSCHVKIASQITNAHAGQKLAARLSAMAQSRAEIDKAIADLKGLKTAPAKSEVDNLNTAAAEYDRLIADIYGSTGSDGKAQAPALSFSTIVKEYGVADAIGNGKGVFVKVQNAAGGLFTRKNIATYFTFNPFSVSASAVVSYSVLDGATEETVAAGTVQRISPYQDVTKVN